MIEILMQQCRFFILKDRRWLILVGILSSVFAMLSLFSNRFIYYMMALLESLNLNVTDAAVSITFLFISIVIFSFIYLQSGGRKVRENQDTSHIYNAMLELEKYIFDLSSKHDELNSKLALYKSEKGLSTEEKNAIIKGAVEQTSEEAIKNIFNSAVTELKKDIKESLIFDKLVSSSRNIIMRLQREIADLRLRANMNLIIGMSITGVGLYLLWSTVSIVDSSELLKQLASGEDNTNSQFFKNLILPIIPRILLIIFIEVFAYFFLKLYKSGLDEIKYFQNELTNIESKLSAIEFSYITNNQDGLKVSIEALSKTERNFILEKGKTTVELEKAKTDTELSKSIIKMIPNIFGKSRK